MRSRDQFPVSYSRNQCCHVELKTASAMGIDDRKLVFHEVFEDHWSYPIPKNAEQRSVALNYHTFNALRTRQPIAQARPMRIQDISCVYFNGVALLLE